MKEALQKQKLETLYLDKEVPKAFKKFGVILAGESLEGAIISLAKNWGKSKDISALVDEKSPVLACALHVFRHRNMPEQTRANLLEVIQAFIDNKIGLRYVDEHHNSVIDYLLTYGPDELIANNLRKIWDGNLATLPQSSGVHPMFRAIYLCQSKVKVLMDVFSAEFESMLCQIEKFTFQGGEVKINFVEYAVLKNNPLILEQLWTRSNKILLSSTNDLTKYAINHRCRESFKFLLLKAQGVSAASYMKDLRLYADSPWFKDLLDWLINYTESTGNPVQALRELGLDQVEYIAKFSKECKLGGFPALSSEVEDYISDKLEEARVLEENLEALCPAPSEKFDKDVSDKLHNLVSNWDKSQDLSTVKGEEASPILACALHAYRCEGDTDWLSKLEQIIQAFFDDSIGIHYEDDKGCTIADYLLTYGSSQIVFLNIRSIIDDKQALNGKAHPIIRAVYLGSCTIKEFTLAVGDECLLKEGIEYLDAKGVKQRITAIEYAILIHDDIEALRAAWSVMKNEAMKDDVATITHNLLKFALEHDKEEAFKYLFSKANFLVILQTYRLSAPDTTLVDCYLEEVETLISANNFSNKYLQHVQLIRKFVAISKRPELETSDEGLRALETKELVEIHQFLAEMDEKSWESVRVAYFDPCKPKIQTILEERGLTHDESHNIWRQKQAPVQAPKPREESSAPGLALKVARFFGENKLLCEGIGILLTALMDRSTLALAKRVHSSTGLSSSAPIFCTFIGKGIVIGMALNVISKLATHYGTPGHER